MQNTFPQIKPRISLLKDYNLSFLVNPDVHRKQLFLFLFLLIHTTIIAGFNIQHPNILKEKKVDSLNDLAVSLQKTASYEESQEHAFVALECATILNYEQGIARALSAISVNYFRTGQYDNSIDYMEKGINIARNRGDSSDVAVGLNNIGSIFTVIGKYEDALKYHKDALRITSSINDISGIATSRGNIGNVYFYLNDYNATLKNYLAALQAYEQLNSAMECMILNINIGNVYLKKREYELALKHLSNAIKINEQANNNDFMADVYNNMGTIYTAQKRYDEALEMHKLSLQLKNEVNDRNGIVNSYKNLGITYLKLQEWGLSRSNLLQGLELSLELGNKQSVSEIYKTLSTLDSISGNFMDALTYFQLYTIYKDSIINESTNQAIAALRIEYETEQKDAEIALLQKERDIQQLELHANLSTIKAINLDIITQRQELELQELNLKIKDREIKQHKTELEANASKLEVAMLSNTLNEKEVLRQKTHKKIILFASLGILAFAGGGVHFFLYRKRTAQKLKEITLELRALRAQIKPHFVFNALNSLRNLIQSGDNENATSYLLNFSTLMRSLLEGSRQEEIPLAQELSTLELYLDLEKCNLGNKLTYKIDVDEDLDTMNTVIFPFLIQPFVENAIIHGISPKGSPGQIQVKIRRDNKLLHISIEDDGIGRAAASSKPKSNIMNKKSHGIKITRERLQMLSLKHNVNCGVSFTDLAQGLKVELSVPYLEMY